MTTNKKYYKYLLLLLLILPITVHAEAVGENMCAREEIPEGQTFFSQELHGILCAKCASGQKGNLRISPSALYAMRFIATAPMGKLYTFTVKEEVLLELEHIIHRYTAANTDKRFRSLQILEVMK